VDVCLGTADLLPVPSGPWGQGRVEQQAGVPDKQGFPQALSGRIPHMGIDRYDGNEIKHYMLDEAAESRDHIQSSTI
jgi:hypothetical protein